MKKNNLASGAHLIFFTGNDDMFKPHIKACMVIVVPSQ